MDTVLEAALLSVARSGASMEVLISDVRPLSISICKARLPIMIVNVNVVGAFYV